MTPDQIVAAMAAAGISNQTQLTGLLTLFVLLGQKQTLSYQVEAARQAQAAATQATETAIQGLLAQIAAIDAQLTAGH